MSAAERLITNPHLNDVVAKGPKDEWSWHLKRTDTKGVFLRNTYRGGVLASCSTMDTNILPASNIEDNIKVLSQDSSTDCVISFKAKNHKFTLGELIYILQTIVTSNSATVDLPVYLSGGKRFTAYSGGVELDLYGNVTILSVD